ncbi:molecular chaperone DnaK [Rhizocola hellebori]|uniref:Molecular chaperone DnaK n=1 Tax=Rhizocola hellebori TaxID=1392758 RepID=A0A8J3QAU9_9ACTN|nr:Hsp70 family protein [Rhizocola hellebori]GIH07156.1 molecular chaperone DnaK [Rhizocola hellebori]
MATRIGIDFGTANTVVAQWNAERDRGEPIDLAGIDVLRPSAAGVTQRVVPSVVAYDRQSGTRTIGGQVSPDMFTDPGQAVFRSTKSVITGRIKDIARQVGAGSISPRHAATQFLSDILAATMLAVDSRDLEIVATAPVEAFDTYRDWMVREVSEQAGLARLRVVDEATAAAVGYSARLNPGDTFMVFDFGAGTLDISVVRVQDAQASQGGGAGVRVVGKAGIDFGGDNIDALLAEHVASRLRLPYGDSHLHNQIFGQLLRSAEAAKMALTSGPLATIRAVHPDGTEYSAEMSRGDFDALLRNKDVTGRVGRALRAALDKAAGAGFVADQIRDVFLVGGTSLIPAIQDVVYMQFPRDIVRIDRPLEAVAAGAAGIAGGYELHDHIQHDYVIRHVNRDTGEYEFESLVPAGTEYPTLTPIKTMTIKGVRDGQRNLGLAIYERAHATFRDASADLEIMFDANGGARAVAVTSQQRQQRSTLWLNEDSPTFLEADPPATAGSDRFRLDFRVDAQKRLTVSAFDLERRTWVLDQQPVVRLS